MQIIIEHYTILINMFIFLFMSAFFSGAETALFSLTQYQLAELNDEKSKVSETILILLKTPSKLLTSILLGNMTVNILFFCFSTVLLSELDEYVHNDLGRVCFAVVVLLIIIIFGEILPKAMAIKNPITFSRLICYPTYLWQYISTPIRIIVMSISSKLEPRKKTKGSQIKTEELKMLLNISKKEGVVNQKSVDMIEDIISLSSLKVKYIMTPRVDVIQCHENETLKKAVSLARTHKVYYLPVFHKTEDNPIGLVRIKDLCLSNNLNGLVKDHIIKPKFVPETITASRLLSKMIKENFKVALVVDEYGGLAGKITIDTILSEVVGELQHNTNLVNSNPIEMIGNQTYRVFARMSINDWEEFFDCKITKKDIINITSIGGFITSLLGRLPKTGDTIIYHNLHFKVESMKNMRIKSLILTIK